MNTHVNDILRGSSEEEEELVNACGCSSCYLVFICWSCVNVMLCGGSFLQFILEGEPPGPLGPGGVRALTMALLISSPHTAVLQRLPTSCKLALQIHWMVSLTCLESLRHRSEHHDRRVHALALHPHLASGRRQRGCSSNRNELHKISYLYVVYARLRTSRTSCC